MQVPQSSRFAARRHFSVPAHAPVRKSTVVCAQAVAELTIRGYPDEEYNTIQHMALGIASIADVRALHLWTDRKEVSATVKLIDGRTNTVMKPVETSRFQASVGALTEAVKELSTTDASVNTTIPAQTWVWCACVLLCSCVFCFGLYLISTGISTGLNGFGKETITTSPLKEMLENVSGVLAGVTSKLNLGVLAAINAVAGGLIHSGEKVVWVVCKVLRK